MNDLVLSVGVNKCIGSFLHTNIALSRFFADFSVCVRLTQTEKLSLEAMNALVLQVGANKCTASFLAHQLCPK